MELDVKYYGRDQIFQVTAQNGYPLLAGRSEGQVKAFRPMELLLAGLVSCSGVDILEILKKQRQVFESYHVHIEGIREEGKVPSLFETIQLIFSFEGDLNPEKVKRAVDLSMEKYCSVSRILSETANIKYEIKINNRLI